MSGRRIAVLGLGNPILKDDAVGLKVIEELDRILTAEPHPGVELLTSQRAGFEVIDRLSGYDEVIIVDAFQAPDTRPGRIRQVEMSQISGSARLMSVHEIGLEAAFELARTLDIPMPGRVSIIGIEADDVYEFGEEMSPDVAAAVGPVVEDIIARLRKRNTP